MCGIAGFVDFSRTKDGSALIRVMTDTMAHRGPDSDGFYTESGLALGHRRLSIIDLSSFANQPFSDNSGRYVMVFNGEIYNYQEIKARLPEYQFRTSSDTEVLIAAYAKWGPECLGLLRGMFAFAIWDKVENELFIARDRMGVKPFYYYLDGNRLLFASELRAILSTGLVEKKINPEAVLEYLSLQSVSYPYSLIKDVVQLEAGSWARIKDGRLQAKRYWDVTVARSGFDFNDVAAVRQETRRLMLQSVRRRLISDVPVGAFLSGGIDSSAIVGLMAEAGDQPPATFNVCFEEKEYDESRYAEIIAEKFHTNHTRILLKPTSFLDELENALDAMDSPSGDGINTYVVSKAVRQKNITVALSGAGGDELFAGYPFFSTYLSLQNKVVWWKLPAAFRRLMTAALLPGPDQGRRGRMSQLLRTDTAGIESVYPIFRQILSPGQLRQQTRLPVSRSFVTAVQRDLAERSEQLSRLPLLSQVSAAEYLGYTQHTLLKDTDQMGMASSLEIREPFFDQDLVEFVMSIPDNLKNPVYPKSFLVDSLKPMLPDEIVFRKKQGFLFPWEVWMRKELNAFCDTHIRDISRREFIDGPGLTGRWKSFLAGDPKVRWSEIWLYVVLEYWMKKNGISS